MLTYNSDTMLPPLDFARDMPTPRRSLRPRTVLTGDTGDQAALITAMAALGSPDSVDRARAVDSLRIRVEDMLRPDSPRLLEELAAQAAVVGSLSHRWAVEALEARNAESAQIFCRMSVACSTAHTRTLIAIASLQAQRRGTATVTVTGHDRDEGKFMSLGL